MRKDEAITNLSIFVLEYRNDIIDIINRDGLGSLTYNSKQSEVNKIVIENLRNKKFVNELNNIVKSKSDYFNIFGIDDAIIIWVTVAIAATTATIGVAGNIYNRKKTEADLKHFDYRNKYLTKEQLEIVQRQQEKEMQNAFLYSQINYMERKKDMFDEKERLEKRNTLIIVFGGVVLISGLAYYINKKR